MAIRSVSRAALFLLAPAALAALGLVASCAAGSDAGPTSAGTGGTAGAGTTGTGTGGSGGGAATTSTGTSGTGGSSGCATDADCAGDPAGPICNPMTGLCLPCLPTDDPCPTGQYCKADTNTCAPGCADATDCGPMLTCDVAAHACVGCTQDTQCPPGTICNTGTCVPGCSAQQACQSGFDCCFGGCFDLQTDPKFCGDCNNACPPPANAQPACVNGMCALGACDPVFGNCNLDPADGCEWNVLQDGACLCAPGATQACYTGAPGTQGVGPCKGGTQTCAPTGTSWSACVGQVLPAVDGCGNGIDEDCNGTIDDGIDADGDGYSACLGDCCDSPGACPNPELVNPGAYEILGNGVDDDCDPSTSDVQAPPTCSSQAKFTGVTADDIAKAMELCQFTTANPPIQQKKWGVISAQHLLAKGSVPSAAELANMQNWQSAVLTGYGTSVTPQKLTTMAGLATGKMRDKGDTGYVAPNPGTNFGNSSQPPSAYLSQHMNKLPASLGCNGACPAGKFANDSDNVRLTIRVPTNAKSFSFQFKYYTAEYWQWSCTEFNDFFLALLQSAAPGIPADQNISFDDLDNPVSVNNGFFNACQVKGCYTCPSGTSPLNATGMDDVVADVVPPLTDGNGKTGGGTSWLTTESPVVPGETMVLDLMVFDVSDNAYDSLVLLDNFAWSPATAVVQTHE